MTNQLPIILCLLGLIAACSTRSSDDQPFGNTATSNSETSQSRSDEPPLVKTTKSNSNSTDGGMTSGGLPDTCKINLLVGRTYAGSDLTIHFLPDNKATYAVSGDDQIYMVTYAANLVHCELILTDSVAPGLSQGRKFWLSTQDLPHIYDENDTDIILSRVAGGELCPKSDFDASLAGKTFLNSTGVTLRFIDGSTFSFDDGRDIQSYTVLGSSLVLHIHDGVVFDWSLSIDFSNSTIRLISPDPIEGTYQRINCK